MLILEKLHLRKFPAIQYVYVIINSFQLSTFNFDLMESSVAKNTHC